MIGEKTPEVEAYWQAFRAATSAPPAASAWACAPLCVLRITKVEVTPFEAVGPELAVAEGEGDLSRDNWAAVHRRYFEKQCAQWGVDWREDLDAVCEYFDLQWTGA